MLVTLSFYTDIAKGPNGDGVPVGANARLVDEVTADGNAQAAPAGCTLVRVATDTAIRIDAGAGAVSELVPANTVEFFKVSAAQVLAIEAV